MAEFDFVATSDWIATARDRSSPQVGQVLDCLDVSLDLARQLGDSRMISLLSQPSRPLCKVFDFVWDEREMPPGPAAVIDYCELMAWWQFKIQY